MRPPVKLLIFMACLLLGWGASAAGSTNEELHYRVDLGIWDDIALVSLVFSQTGPDRYQAELTCAPHGLWNLLSRWLPESYHTEMVYRQGRLQPLLHREVAEIKGRRVVKEYRFDYENAQIEYWRKQGDGPLVRKGLIPLSQPVYDPLSLFYNARVGGLGPLPSGETLHIRMLNAEPEEMVIRIGADTLEGRRVMLNLRELNSGQESDPYFVFFSPEWVPRQAWLRVTFGKLSGTLENPEAISQSGLLAAGNSGKKP